MAVFTRSPAPSSAFAVRRIAAMIAGKSSWVTIVLPGLRKGNPYFTSSSSGEINHLVPRAANARHQFLLQREAAVIRGNTMRIPGSFP